MVGQKPPLPRSYPIFRFATALAAFLFVFTYATNQVSMMAASAPQAAYGIGGGAPEERPQSGGGDGNDVAEAPLMEAMPAATELPVEPEATMEMALTGPVADATPTPELAADTSRTTNEPPAAKDPGAESPAPLRISSILMIAFAAIALLGAATMFLLQRLTAKKWRGK